MALALAFEEWDAPSTSAVGERRYEAVAMVCHLQRVQRPYPAWLGVPSDPHEEINAETKAEYRLRKYLYPRNIASSSTSAESSSITDDVLLVREEGRVEEVFGDFLDAVDGRFSLVRKDISRFINRVKETEALSSVPQINIALEEFLDRLAMWHRAWGVSLKIFEDPSLITRFTTHFNSLLHSSLPASFPSYLDSFLSSSLAALPPELSDPPSSSPPLTSIPINPVSVPPPSPHLTRLGFVSRYSSLLFGIASREIDRIAREEAEKGWEGRRLPRARARIGSGLAAWLRGLHDDSWNAKLAGGMVAQFEYRLSKTFFEIRSDELFDIIVDYPESTAALEDLKDCLAKIDQRGVLVEKLTAANVKRLLHPGAETKDVIAQYISTIRCLRLLDPPGVLLHKVADPIRRHLRERPDTIRCIVAALVDGEQLEDENEASAGLIATHSAEQVENFVDAKWDPEPIDAAPEFRSGKASDIISTLVSIYESREVIISDLQAMLASRLLDLKGYDAVKEIRIIELLKLRFGEPALHTCDVMLKDVADSKRINDHIQSELSSIVQPLVISRLFWPTVPSSALRLPPKLEAVQVEYELAFHKFKPDKRLRWLQHLGTAKLKIELEDRTLDVDATPLQASIMELFESSPTWTTEALKERLGVESGAIRNDLLWWAGQGVLKEVNGSWILLEIAEDTPAGGTAGKSQLEEAPVINSLDPTRAERTKVHWNYIKGVLTNLGPRNTDYIHGTLSSFVDGFDQTPEELNLFLSGAKREGLLNQRQDGAWVLL